ncbi:MAG: PilZ domain-containing protein [Rhizobiales bacterium]|nr:PilZ domain-containing protein [Hyphomicrobiales bacterium]
MRFHGFDFILSEQHMGRFQSVLAARERRKARRYGVEVKALIKVDDEFAERQCTIHDISQTGAFIAVEDGDTLEHFTLTVSRQCRVIRRNKEGTRIGVEFLVPWSVAP